MMNIEAYMANFKEEYQARITPTTINGIQLATKQLLVYCQKSVSDIQTSDARNWLTHLQNSGYAQSSVATKLASIKTFFRYCLEEDIISRNPLVSIVAKREKYQTPKYLKMDQLEQLRKVSSIQCKQRAIVEVLYATGVRISELCAMKLEDIQWSRNLIHIPKGKGEKARMVVFTRACEEYLKAYLQERTDDLPFLFLDNFQKGPIRKHVIHHYFAKYREELGFHVTPHTLRHTFAAHLAIRGMRLMSLQVLLGHEEPSHTQVYTQLYQQAQKDKYDEWM